MIQGTSTSRAKNQISWSKNIIGVASSITGPLITATRAVLSVSGATITTRLGLVNSNFDAKFLTDGAVPFAATRNNPTPSLNKEER